jgi:hypothetical protein
VHTKLPGAHDKPFLIISEFGSIAEPQAQVLPVVARQLQARWQMLQAPHPLTPPVLVLPVRLAQARYLLPARRPVQMLAP